MTARFGIQLLRLATTALAVLSIASLAWAAGPDPDGAVGSHLGAIVPNVNCNRVLICGPGLPLMNGEAYAGGTLTWRTNFFANALELVDTSAGCAVRQTCPAPGANAPSELTLLNGILYHYDFGTGLLYGINTTTCQVVSTCNPPGDDLAEGLTNDGTYLWKGSSDGLYKFSPPTAAGGCQVVQFCPNPAGDSADGLTMCQGNLIMLGYSGNLYEIDPASCSVLGLCPLNAGPNGNGIASDRSSIVYVDDDSGKLDKVDAGCDIPVPVRTHGWGKVKSTYR